MSLEVKITAIHNNPVGKDTKEKLNDEYIVIKNTGDVSVSMDNWQVTDWRPEQKHIHTYTFPPFIDSSTWTLDPGEYIFLMTGKGTNVFIPEKDDKPPQFHFYWNKDWFVWNNTGDTACLYNSSGNLVHSLNVL
ncbi:lamin tail domain-containing protein [Ruminiclostridium josui]|uniref:lamin tail domain-containing protein n=1 Tax=Ruminiclostridium josui TaxID=1499 RepID=UPI0004676590|nr:lamin tail domain-containing protein [Ruminiclostridium josui]